MLRTLILATVVALAASQSLDIPHLAEKLGATDLVSFVVKANLSQALSSPGPFTVFGPTNDAFARLPPALVHILENNVTLLRDVLLYHVVAGRVYSSDLSNNLLAQSLLPAEKIRINIYSGEKTVSLEVTLTDCVLMTNSSIVLLEFLCSIGIALYVC